jgi:hypothetical protein
MTTSLIANAATTSIASDALQRLDVAAADDDRVLATDFERARGPGRERGMSAYMLPRVQFTLLRGISSRRRAIEMSGCGA